MQQTTPELGLVVGVVASKHGEVEEKSRGRVSYGSPKILITISYIQLDFW